MCDFEGSLDRLAGAGFEAPLIFELTLAEALASLEVIWEKRPSLADA